jgi:hypothetical protein
MVGMLVMENTGKAAAPEFQPPVCCLLPVVLLWAGSWLTPMRWLLDGYVTEWGHDGKWEILAF